MKRFGFSFNLKIIMCNNIQQDRQIFTLGKNIVFFRPQESFCIKLSSFQQCISGDHRSKRTLCVTDGYGLNEQEIGKQTEWESL